VLQCTLLLQQRATQNRFLYSLIIIAIFLACYHVAKNEKKYSCAFVGAPFRPNMLNMPKSASVAQQAGDHVIMRQTDRL